MFRFLRSVGDVLPCKRCRMHYNAYVFQHVRTADSPPLAHREALSRFLVDLHNDVNRRLDRAAVPYEAVRHTYEVDCESHTWWSIVLCTVVVLAMVWCVVIMLRRRRDCGIRSNRGVHSSAQYHPRTTRHTLHV